MTSVLPSERNRGFPVTLSAKTPETGRSDTREKWQSGAEMSPDTIPGGSTPLMCREVRHRGPAISKGIGAPLTPEIAIDAGIMKRPGISVADAIIAASALSVNASVVTNDPHFSELDVEMVGYL